MRPKIRKKPPGPKAKRIVAQDKKMIPPTTKGVPLAFSKGKGANIWDVDGNVYLDFATGIGVNALGHANPMIIKAVTEQIKKVSHIAFTDFYSDVPLNFAKEIFSISSMKKYNQVFFSNSGAESIECAMKMARYHTGRKYFISFYNAFHGRTYGALSLTASKPVHRMGFGPFLSVIHVPYADSYRCPLAPYPDVSGQRCLRYIEEVVFRDEVPPKEIAAIFYEPIQGEGGIVIPDPGFMKGLEKICRKHGILLIADEIQAGYFRTGKFLASEHYGIKPDIVCMAKPIGGGLPLGATIATKKIFNWESGSHATTFGGNLLSCSAGLASLKYIKKKKLEKKIRRDGEYIMNFLKDLKTEKKIIGDVRGKGLMIGIDLVKNRVSKKPATAEKEKIVKKAFEKGLILLPAGRSVVRLLPPYILTKEEIDSGLEILRDCFKGFK